MTELTVQQTPIPGLLVISLPMPGDNRGWFKENWQRQKMVALGLPDFGPVQNNMSFNNARGATRGLHAEPWDKYVSLATGRIMGAWVDLREGDSFGATFSLEMGPETAVFVPRGVANGYQALEDGTAYTYLVNDHWSPEARSQYTYLNLADETAAIAWPIGLDQAEISDADKQHPRLADVTPMKPARTVVLGAKGQLGQSLMALLPDATGIDRNELDLADRDAVQAYNWNGVGTIINAAAYTAVDQAETEQGRKDCWAANVHAVQNLVEVCRERRMRLAHVSSDYVFDGTVEEHDEDEAFSPLGVYGQTKAAADAIVATLPRHWIVRTSWVIGGGKNFVGIMADLAAKGVKPTVVADQHGRLTFTADLAAGIVHLLDSGAAPGTYNLTNTGEVQSWADIAKRVFELCGKPTDDVTPVSTEEYTAGKLVSPRPTHSALKLDKIIAAGFTPPPAEQRLQELLG
ncbi:MULTISPECIES: bifunctional dTDP-4-dehydrorhamnose 3,5-epimerase family protein/NAD(P)-dependent oxidoreductase [unclassified Luteococcus]|uniref:bifunctional dTDP-4-dehydrorhamnose 3,5-epimerase family protein/NAD(P)-dependent oxidoreductase n=1 Tax=unclassified Luteococcus TaxID=2639923 RepID=UPI00313E91BB